MVVQDQLTWKELEAQLIARAWTDEAFAEELRRHPKATIEREMGQRLPADVNVRVLDEPANTLYLVIPAKPDSVSELDELSEEELTSTIVNVCPCICSVGPHCNTQGC
jgi:Nitrile hydratase, alpha chain